MKECTRCGRRAEWHIDPVSCYDQGEDLCDRCYDRRLEEERKAYGLSEDADYDEIKAAAKLDVTIYW